MEIIRKAPWGPVRPSPARPGEEREAGPRRERFHGASWREMGAAVHAQVARLQQEEVGEQGCCAAVGSLLKK